jgi:hemerythrin superfamily protein
MVRISEAITQDHQKLEYYYDTIVNSEDEDEQTRFQNQFTWELARHAVAEELVVYPAIEKVVPEGNVITNKHLREHSTVGPNIGSYI